MKKLLIAGLSAAVLVATSSVAFAANPTGKISGFYSPAQVEVDSADDDVNVFGLSGEMSFGNKFGVDASYQTGTIDDSETDVSAFDINGTYTLLDSKNTGKLDATLGYVKASISGDDMVYLSGDWDFSGITVGAKGNYDLGNKFGFDYKLSYAPSAKWEIDGTEVDDVDVTALQYKVGVFYQVNKQFTVDAGYKGININLSANGRDIDLKNNGFYVGGSMKF